MTIRERKRSKNIKGRDLALRIPRTAKQSGRYIHDAGQDIQERRDDATTATEYATSHIQNKARQVAGGAWRDGKAALRISNRAVQKLRRSRKAEKHLIAKKVGEGENAIPSGGVKAKIEQSPSQRNYKSQFAKLHEKKQAIAKQQTVSNNHFSDNVEKTLSSLNSKAAEQTRTYRVREIQEQGRARFRQEQGKRSINERRMLRNGQSQPLLEIRTRDSTALQKSLNIQERGVEPRSFPFAKIAKSDKKTVAAPKAAGKIISSARKETDKVHRAIKDTSSSVKTVTRSVKEASRSIKTVQETAKAAAKSAQATKKTVELAKQAFIKVARVTATTIKAAAKAIVAAVKALIASAKALAAAIAAGGGVALVVVLVIALIAAIFASPIGVFFSSDSGGITMPQAMSQTRAEFRQRIEEIKYENPADRVILDYEGEDIINNWRDIIAIFAVATTTDPENALDVVTLDDERLERFMDIAFAMNPLEWRVEDVEEEIEAVGEDGTAIMQAQTVSAL